MDYKVLKVKKGKRTELVELVSDDGYYWRINQGVAPSSFCNEDKHIFKIMKEYRDDGYTIIEIMDNTKLDELEEKATKKQKWYIHELVKKIGWNDEEYKKFLFDNFKVGSSKDLSKREASKLIDKLINIKSGIPETEIDLPEMEWEV